MLEYTLPSKSKEVIMPDADRFVTVYGTHLGQARFFLVVENNFMLDSKELSSDTMRDEILKGTPFLHQSLMKDSERDYLHREYF